MLSTDYVHVAARQLVRVGLVCCVFTIPACPTASNPSGIPCNQPLPYNANEADDEVQFLTHDGLERRYIVHPPSGWDGETSLPVVLALHGGTCRAEVERTASGMNAVADENGFLAVYPDGTGNTVRLRGEEASVLTWNAGGCCGSAVDNDIDDVGFFSAVLDDLAGHYAVDTRRVYATGISNGAMMCYRLATELSERITAIAPVAGSMMVDGPQPTRPVPVLHFHGLEDQSAPFDGGYGLNRLLNPVVHNSIPDTIAWWVEVNDCLPTPTVVLGVDFTVERYDPVSGETGAPVVLYTLPEGGHTWPGGLDVTDGTGELIESVEASAIMWDFFQGFQLP